jgi:hypothetical protein
MHFRLGDYKKIQDFHPIMSIEYYINALNSVLNQRPTNNSVNNPIRTVLYFCEDDDFECVSEKIKELSRNFPRMTFERRSVLEEDWEEIIAMSLCRHNIIANSSFSYFGAYFNTQADVQVYYPSVWLGPAFATKDTTQMCPPHWIKVITQ